MKTDLPAVMRPMIRPGRRMWVCGLWALLASGLSGCVDLFESPTVRTPADSGPRDGSAPAVEVGPPDAAPCLPVPETCNAVDDDCDGTVDEALDAQLGVCTAGLGVCATEGQLRCDPEAGRLCDAVPGAAELERCNGLDDDCDGSTDEGFVIDGRAAVCCGVEDATPPCNGCPTGSERPPDGWVCIPAGLFEMGRSDVEAEAGAHPDALSHRVAISAPFWMMATEVTRAQWMSVSGGADPAAFAFDSPTCRGDAEALCPVQRVSWLDAVWFAIEATAEMGLAPCYPPPAPQMCTGDPSGGCIGEREQCSTESEAEVHDCDPMVVDGWSAVTLRCPGLRLPTEAEWEYANRAGGRARFWHSNRVDDLRDVAWYRDNSGARPQRVGLIKSGEPEGHPWGLHDTHGNVSEWVQDSYGQYAAIVPEAEPDEPAVDPVAAVSGADRVFRGGAFDSPPDDCASAARDSIRHHGRNSTIGLRLVRPIVPMVE